MSTSDELKSEDIPTLVAEVSNRKLSEEELAEKEAAASLAVSNSELVSLDNQTLAQYYAGSQFEFGLPSLCRMILPSNLRGRTIVDLGCRRGRGVFKLSDRVGEHGKAIGVEWAKAFVDEAKSKMDRAWQDTGLPANNMEFHHAYPEDLAAAGIADESADVVYVNSVSNLFFDLPAAYAEICRILKPGGILINETVLANQPRDKEVVRQARAIGNSVQAALVREDFERILTDAGFKSVSYQNPERVQPTTGALPQRPADIVETEEDARFLACVAIAEK